MKKGVDVFISYRRKGGREIARNINDRLTLRGYSVFFDYESIRDGRFNTQIFEAIDKAKDFIFVLSDSALEGCANEEDWVRTELEYALKLDKHIMLVCPGESFDGFPSDLPESLLPIKDLQIHYLSQRYYDQSIEEVVSSLNCDRKRKWHRYALILAAVLAAGLALYLYTRGGTPSSGASPVSVQCYLARYRDLSLYEGLTYGDDDLKAFQYEDTLDGPDYTVYPLSDFYYLRAGHHVRPMREGAVRTHSPVFTLRLINGGRKTVVINSAAVEIRNVSPAFASPVSILDTWDGYRIHGLSADSCRISYEVVDTRTGRIVRSGTAPAEAGVFVFSPDEKPAAGRMIVGTVDAVDGRIPFIISGRSLQAARAGIGDPQLPYVSFTAGKTEHRLSFSSFQDRNLVSGETDDRFHFSVRPDASCSFEMRVVLRTVEGTTLPSDWIKVSVFKP